MNREELFRKVKAASHVAWLAENEAINKFYVTLLKLSIGIVPFMIIAIVINGGIMFDIVMSCIYLSMVIFYAGQKPYIELKVYTLRYFGNIEVLNNTLKSIDKISKAEKEIKNSKSKEDKEVIYQNMIDELDGLYGKGNHLFLNNAEVVRREEKAQLDDDIREARAKYQDKIKEINQEAERKAKEILTEWFAPIIKEYDQLIQIVKKHEALQFDIEGSKEEREARKEKNGELIENQKVVLQKMLSDIRNKYTVMSEGVDTLDELNIEACMINKLYNIGFKADGDQETNGLCTLLSVIINQDMVHYPQYRHGQVMIAMKRSYEILQSLGLYHPDVDRERYQGYCIYAAQERQRKNSKEYKEAEEKKRREEQKKKWKEWEKEEKARQKEKEKRIKPILKDLEQWEKKQEYIKLRRHS